MRDALKHFARNVVRHFGYEIVPGAAIEERAFGRHLAKLFEKLDIRCVLDVGANRGQYYRFLRNRVGYRGLVISFEPVARNVARLQELARTDARWVIRGYALGSEDTRADINVMRGDHLSSFLSPDHSNVPMLSPFNVVDRRERVEVHRLDSVIGELRTRYALRNVYLKMDTQGFELEVIRGASSTLPAIRALQAELSMQRIYESAPRSREILDYLSKQSFDVTGMFPVVRDDLMRVVEFDCVMINNLSVQE